MRLKPAATLTIAVAAMAGFAAPIHAQEQERCAPAERFLTQDREMVAVMEPDTIDDWRTDQLLPGCRVTAAGLTTAADVATESERFYERLQAAGWTRTPDPQDAPNESSVRFRRGDTDCLFNVYEGPLVATPTEIEVTTAVSADYGETRYNVLVQCMPAMEAA